MKSKKTNIILLIVLIVIIILIVILVSIHRHPKEAETTTTIPSTTEETTLSSEQVDEENDLPDWGNGTFNIKKKGSSYAMYMGDVLYPVTGLFYEKLPGTFHKDCYYFKDGIWDKSHSGVEIPPGDSPYVNRNLVHVKNGRVDLKYTGLISYDKYLRIFENGKYRQDYNGKVHLPDGDFDVHHGAVYGYCLGQPDGFEWKPVFWSLDGEPTAYHKS